MNQLLSKYVSPLAVIGCLFGIADSAHAKQLKWTQYGVRPLAMGNAYVAVADDYNALFYNPAGLARLKEWDGELINPTLTISKNTRTFIKDAQGVQGSDSSAVLDILQSQLGTTHYASLGLTPHLIFPGFGFGIGMEFFMSMAIHREIAVDLDTGISVIMPFSYARNFLEDRLSIGASVKLVNRTGIDKEFSIENIEAFSANKDSGSGPTLTDYAVGGNGVGADFGMLFTPIKPMEPTLGLSITDFGGTSFKATSAGSAGELSAPATRQPSFNTGFSIKPWQTARQYLMLSVDEHAINQPAHYSKKLNFGSEYGLGSIVKFQLGLHQGEMSGGTQIDVGLLNIRFATWAEQLGELAGQSEKLSDRRFSLQLKLLI